MRRFAKTAANVIEIVNYVKDMQQLHSNASNMPKHAKILRLSHAINDSLPPTPSPPAASSLPGCLLLPREKTAAS